MIFVGFFARSNSDIGFLGISEASTLLSDNAGSQYTETQGIDYDFAKVLAVFFPAVTGLFEKYQFCNLIVLCFPGIMAGANISSQLENPSKNIPTVCRIVDSFVPSRIFL